MVKGERELDLLKKIHKRLGWIMFWIILVGIAVVNSIVDLSDYLKFG